MNNEIKEILDFKENADYKKLSCDEIKVLRDYITNLQQDNKKISIQHLETVNKLIEVQSRIEKAVEYIEHSKFIKEQVIMRSNYDMQDFQIRELLNILRGKDNE